MRFKYIGLWFVFFLSLKMLNAQNIQLSSVRFQPLRSGRLPFTPYILADFSLGNKSKTEADFITLPNKKRVTAGSYLRTINTIEKNLAEIGISKDRPQALVVASAYKPVSSGLSPISLPTALKNLMLSKTAMTTRFDIMRMALSYKAIQLSGSKAQLVNALIPDADNLSNEPFSKTEDISVPEFKVADYGVKIKAAYTRKGVLDPFSLSGTKLREDSLRELIRNTANEFTLGFNMDIRADIAGLGDFPVYKLESEFTGKANKALKHRIRTKLQILDRILLNETSTPSDDQVAYKKDAVFNTKQKLGAADIFTYGLNILLPVDIYLSSTGVGAEFDMNISRTGVGGTISPIVTQSVFLETSATETTGPVADLLNFDVLDIGVGGEVRLIQGGLDFGGNAGLAVTGNGLQFINDTYSAARLKFLRGRLYTFYSYPVYTCKSIFDAMDPDCYAVRRVENNFFDTGSFLEFQQVLLDDFQGRNLNWR